MKKILILSAVLVASSTVKAQEVTGSKLSISSSSTVSAGETLANINSNSASGNSDGTVLNIQTGRGDTGEQKLISASNNVGEKFYLKANGNTYLSNVAIGTTDFSGNHKLRVEGSIGAREIKVEASGWSDFVFEKDYKLRTLEEVENYITENKHLPEIPNEAEVTENGINLGEMNAKLLQKIEELTLYMIEMNKRVNQLERENTEFKESNQELQKEVSALNNE